MQFGEPKRYWSRRKQKLVHLRVIDPRQAGDEEVVGVGDDLTPETLVWAYRHGIFPWPMDLSSSEGAGELPTGRAGESDRLPILWFCPPQRAILDFDRLRVSDRLARFRRSAHLSFTIDRAFDQVIASCRTISRPGQDGTWITPEMLGAYTRLNRLGFAHSVEAWDSEGALVGGLYGIAVAGVFSGESMFHLTPNASKLALLYLVDHLRSRGADWIDIQTMTPHFAALGASMIPRNDFLDRLEATHARRLKIFD